MAAVLCAHLVGAASLGGGRSLVSHTEPAAGGVGVGRSQSPAFLHWALVVHSM